MKSHRVGTYRWGFQVECLLLYPILTRIETWLHILVKISSNVFHTDPYNDPGIYPSGGMDTRE
jgi:hypothetical protein